MFHFCSKHILLSAILLIGMLTSSGASDTDSLVYEDLQQVKKRIDLLLYRLNNMNQALGNNQDSVLILSNQTLNDLEADRKSVV